MGDRKKSETPELALAAPDAVPDNQGSLVEPEDAGSDPAVRFPVVGIGASAGGLAAFEGFFSGIPRKKKPGMAFVLVQHLAPDHKSILTDLIQRYTSMRVFEVEDGMAVQPNCAYIIPPNCDMVLLKGVLHLLEPVLPRGHRLPIDFFFRSLAQDQHDRAICIVLSGTGSDGTLGMRAIKGEGGIAMAQTPESTEYDGMPRSAIATGLVDYVLPPAAMAAELVALVGRALAGLPRRDVAARPGGDSAMKKIFGLLRAQTGHDLSGYKLTTVRRRIERRLAVNQIDSMDDYATFLQRTPDEVEALFRDLLIGVTSFFRDPEAFGVLEDQVIPKLFAGKPAGSLIRAWSPGCSTGEEAYSIAMLFQERVEALKQGHTVQLFATDIDKRAIATARAGLYPVGIASDVSPERLARFFVLEPDGSAYRINKRIRDSVVFSEQDVTKDPPFSRLDLISCRNLLIYMGADLQKKLIPLFGYALRPGGALFLGTAETVGSFTDLFAPLNAKLRLYLRKAEYVAQPRLPTSLPPPPVQNMGPWAVGPEPPRNGRLRELTEQALLRQMDQIGMLVNSRGEVLYLHGHTGNYLELAPGEAGVNNVLRMARKGLRGPLTTALNQAVATREVVQVSGLRVKTNSHFTGACLSILPVPEVPSEAPESSLFLIVLEEEHTPEEDPTPGTSLARAGGPNVDAEERIAELNRELRDKEEYLEASNEELVTSNEELKSSNEELQSVNEELQSTNEELETSKEELQSVNEELSTVNAELQSKVTDLSQANNDMNNLLAGTGIGTVFVDHQLRILRFTPAVARILNLIAADVGRPVGQIVSNLSGYTSLLSDTQAVLDNLTAREEEVRTVDGRWYAMRIQPYRTIDNVIEGAVITFADISEAVRTRNALRQTNELLRRAFVERDAIDAVSVQDLTGRILAWSRGAERTYGWSEAEALKMNFRDRIPDGLREEPLVMLRRISSADSLEPHRAQRITRDGSVIDVEAISVALLNASGEIYAYAMAERPQGKDQGVFAPLASQ